MLHVLTHSFPTRRSSDLERRAARMAAPAAPAPVKSLDAARIASTWPATSRPGNAAPEPVMTAAPLRVPVRVSLSAEAAAAPGRGHPLGMTGVPALPSRVAAAAMDDAQANADAAFVDRKSTSLNSSHNCDD